VDLPARGAAFVNGSRPWTARHVAEVCRRRANQLVNIQMIRRVPARVPRPAASGGRASAALLLIISGAFGLFRRQTVIDAGGYDATTVGEGCGCSSCGCTGTAASGARTTASSSSPTRCW
jgi:hypothetical protein